MYVNTLSKMQKDLQLLTAAEREQLALIECAIPNHRVFVHYYFLSTSRGIGHSNADDLI